MQSRDQQATISGYRLKYPERETARKAVQRAFRAGLLRREPCFLCRAEKGHAHHRDYSRPLEVIWLCASCHAKLRGRPDAAVKEIEADAEATFPLRLMEVSANDYHRRMTCPDPSNSVVDTLSAWEVLLKMPLRIALVLIERFGLDGCGPRTLDEVGARYGVGRERCRQIELRGLRIARNLLLPLRE